MCALCVGTPPPAPTPTPHDLSPYSSPYGSLVFSVSVSSPLFASSHQTGSLSRRGLPEARTCDRVLVLPNYSSYDDLHRAFTIALEYGSVGYHMA
jgi:hypothetical protein